jgi:hypothetical protein
VSFPATLEDILLHCVNITAPPRKCVLRMLAEYTHDATEQQVLYLLASREGAAAHQRFITEGAPTIADVLNAFPSCRPSVRMRLFCCYSLFYFYYFFGVNSVMFYLLYGGYSYNCRHVACVPVVSFLASNELKTSALEKS